MALVPIWAVLVMFIVTVPTVYFLGRESGARKAATCALRSAEAKIAVEIAREAEKCRKEGPAWTKTTFIAARPIQHMQSCRADSNGFLTPVGG